MFDIMIEIGSPLFWLGLALAVIGGPILGLIGLYIFLGKRIKN